MRVEVDVSARAVCGRFQFVQVPIFPIELILTFTDTVKLAGTTGILVQFGDARRGRAGYRLGEEIFDHRIQRLKTSAVRLAISERPSPFAPNASGSSLTRP